MTRLHLILPRWPDGTREVLPRMPSDPYGLICEDCSGPSAGAYYCPACQTERGHLRAEGSGA